MIFLQSLGLLLFGTGLLAWPRLHPLDTRRRLLVPYVLIGLLLALMATRHQLPAYASEPSAPRVTRTVAVPDVEGMPVEEAVDALEAAGLEARVVEVCLPGAVGQVVTRRADGVERSSLVAGVGLEDSEGPLPGRLDKGTEVVLVVPDPALCSSG